MMVATEVRVVTKRTRHSAYGWCRCATCAGFISRMSEADDIVWVGLRQKKLGNVGRYKDGTISIRMTERVEAAMMIFKAMWMG